MITLTPRKFLFGNRRRWRGGRFPSLIMSRSVRLPRVFIRRSVLNVGQPAVVVTLTVRGGNRGKWWVTVTWRQPPVNWGLKKIIPLFRPIPVCGSGVILRPRQIVLNPRLVGLNLPVERGVNWVRRLFLKMVFRRQVILKIQIVIRRNLPFNHRVTVFTNFRVELDWTVLPRLFKLGPPRPSNRLLLSQTFRRFVLPRHFFHVPVKLTLKIRRIIIQCRRAVKVAVFVPVPFLKLPVARKFMTPLIIRESQLFRQSVLCCSRRVVVQLLKSRLGFFRVKSVSRGQIRLIVILTRGGPRAVFGGLTVLIMVPFQCRPWRRRRHRLPVFNNDRLMRYRWHPGFGGGCRRRRVPFLRGGRGVWLVCPRLTVKLFRLLFSGRPSVSQNVGSDRLWNVGVVGPRPVRPFRLRPGKRVGIQRILFILWFARRRRPLLG